MLERATLENKSIGYIATARSLFGHWIEQRERSMQRREMVNRDGVGHHYCPVLAISCEAEQLHTPLWNLDSRLHPPQSPVYLIVNVSASQITRGTRLDIKCLNPQTQLLLRC